MVGFFEIKLEFERIWVILNCCELETVIPKSCGLRYISYFFRDMSRAPRLWGTPYTKAIFGRVSSNFGISIIFTQFL
jgi:hypothetical protein